MVITAVAIGTRGDANPLAELGWEMIRRGHEKLERDLQENSDDTGHS